MTQGWSTASRAAVLATGVHLPFTAPLLTGTRGRLRGRTIDFILPNPSGGRGAYVAVWSMVKDLAGPTVHDTILSRRLPSLTSLTPAAVRGLSRAVAAEGYAGRAATTAAIRAQTAIDAEALRLWAMLLMALIRSSTIPSIEHTKVLASLGSAGPGQITDGFVSVAQRLGWKPAQLAEGLQQVSAALVPVAEHGRMRRLLTKLGSMQTALADEHQQQLNMAARPTAALLRTIQSVGQCLVKANTLLSAATLALDDPSALLERWRLDPVTAMTPVVALEELLDGWDRICLLWLDAATLSARIDVLPEIALLVRLAAETNPVGAADPVARPASASGPGADKPDAATVDRTLATSEAQARESPPAVIVERNERIRALELGLDGGNG